MTKAKIFDTMVFADTNAAQAIINGFDEKIKRIKIGLILCGVSLLMALISVYAPRYVSSFFYYGAFVVTIFAYIISGGLKIALRTAFKFAKIGWFILPFPLDIFTGLVTFIVSLFLFAYLPIIFVLVSLLQTIRDKREAEAYLTYGASMYQQSQYAEAQYTAPVVAVPQGSSALPTPPPFI